MIESHTSTNGGHPMFFEILNRMAELHYKKNRNYSGGTPLGNLRACEAIGIPAWKGVMVRLQDKWARLVQLTNGEPDLVGESMIDTLMDNAIYSVLCIILLSEEGVNE